MPMTSIGKVKLLSGTDLILESLQVYPTYLGLMIGSPDRADHYLNQWRPDFNKDAFYPIPAESISYEHPRKGKVERFPYFVLVGELVEVRKDDLRGATVVLMVETLPDNPIQAFKSALETGDIPWDTFAKEFLP